MHAESRSLDRIRASCPEVEIRRAEADPEGLVNETIIVNGEWVYRFPRGEWGRVALEKELAILDLVHGRIGVPVPRMTRHEDGEGPFVSYRLIEGTALQRSELLMLPPRRRNRLIDQLAAFLRDLHAIPMTKVERHGIPRSDAMRSPESWACLYDEVRRELFPVVKAFTREWLRRHFEPVLAEPSILAYRPALIHGDLGPWHILFDRGRTRLNGVIDFGTGGYGDPAHDIGVMIHVYGETAVRRMARVYPGIAGHIERARFMAGCAEVGWLLNGLHTGEPVWLSGHLTTARDMMPVGSGWKAS